MLKEDILKKIASLSEIEEWNHHFKFPYGIETKSETVNSPGNNLQKWKRLEALLINTNIEDKTILDVGCSDGYYSVNFALKGAKKVLGVDLDDLRIQRAKYAAKVLGVKNVDFKNLDIYGKSLEGQHYDIVLALGVLHRIPDLYGFIKRITQLADTVVLEFKTSKSSASVCEWGGAETKGNKFNNLYFLPSIKLVDDILKHFNFKISIIDKDKSKLKFKRTIIVAKRMQAVKNNVFESYKDKHLGERVFLIGNGPSLADTNLNLLKDENTIAMNRISMIYPKFKNWRPNYYLFSSTNVKDKTWGQEWLSSVKFAISEPKTKSFIASEFKKYIDPNDEHMNVDWFDSMTENRPNERGEISTRSFSTDIIERIDKSGTSMNLALQLAYHMGFKEIVLIGADLGWTKDLGSKTDPNHFDKNYRASITNPHRANQQMRNVHKLALSIFKRNKPDVKIYNASIKSVLDTYPMIKFEEYVVNNEIIIRKSANEEAKTFWKNQIYQPPKPKPIIYRIIRKIKRYVLNQD